MMNRRTVLATIATATTVGCIGKSKEQQNENDYQGLHESHVHEAVKVEIIDEDIHTNDSFVIKLSITNGVIHPLYNGDVKLYFYDGDTVITTIKRPIRELDTDDVQAIEINDYGTGITNNDGYEIGVHSDHKQ